jgi:hypothetical protein
MTEVLELPEGMESETRLTVRNFLRIVKST